VRSAYSLIRPPSLEFDYYNTQIHGITAEDVRHKPTFSQLWDRIRPYLEEKVVIAHNAAFDISVLRSVLAEYSLPQPKFRYACTVALAKKVWTDLENYKLDTLADKLAVTFDHHNALHDARVCAKIALEAQSRTKTASFLELTEKLSVNVRDFK
jgi:DNA polymerase-3 subunit epsilon